MEVRGLAAAVMWTAALCMALARTFTNTMGLTVWAVLCGQGALCLTGWIIFERTTKRTYESLVCEMREMDDATVERVAARLAGALREGNVSALR